MRIFFLCSGLVIFLTSCAVTRDNVTIRYDSLQTTERVAEAEYATVNVQVSDDRPHKERVGRKKNGYGMDCASIMSENDVSLVVKDAISEELKKKGFQLSDAEKAAVIDVNLKKFYNEFKPGFFVGKALSEMVVTVKVLGEKKHTSFAKTLIGTGLNKDVTLYSGKSAKKVLEDALRNTISELLQDQEFIDALLQTGKLENAVTHLESS